MILLKARPLLSFYIMGHNCSTYHDFPHWRKYQWCKMTKNKTSVLTSLCCHKFQQSKMIESKTSAISPQPLNRSCPVIWNSWEQDFCPLPISTFLPSYAFTSIRLVKWNNCERDLCHLPIIAQQVMIFFQVSVTCNSWKQDLCPTPHE